MRAALDHSPRVQSALAARETALAYRSFSTLPRAGNPQVSARALIGQPDGRAATYGLVLGLPFDVSGRRPAWRREASSIIAEAESLLEAARNDVRADALQAYTEVAVAEAARLLAEESVVTARELFERVRMRVEASASTALDLALAESQLAEAEADLQRAHRSLVEAEGAFRQVLDLPPLAPVELAPLPAPTLPDGFSVDDAIARAMRLRREPLAFASVAKRWRAADRRLRAEAVGPMVAALEGERQGVENPQSSVGASVGFELPFIQRNQGERAVARKQALAADVERELTEHTIAREAATAFMRLEAALRELAALDERAIPAAERTLVYVRTLLDSGAIDYFRLLAARRTAYQLRSRRIAALREAWLGQITLQRAVGGWGKTP